MELYVIRKVQATPDVVRKYMCVTDGRIILKLFLKERKGVKV
jgi:hypothetical protein